MMRLAKLTLGGFKSFADKTEIAFDAPITGIVGPNGCGKSNVVDAIKWVLGELSAKSLRGGAMMDMIFNGSSTRKPAGMASVTLTFDNPIQKETGQRRLPVNFDTVAITRQLFRDGSSEYLINKKRCRLRDIREIFMDTGIGTDAYSIIEQGKVDVMLQSNAQERREIFEEAAGISRFKARKKEASRKLERTEQNLNLARTRLEDTERRLRSVKVQAGRARSYQEYTVQLRDLQLQHALSDYSRLSRRRDEVIGSLEQAQADQSRIVRILGECEQNLSDSEIAKSAVSSELRRVEHERLAQQAARQQAQQRQTFASSTLEDLHKQIHRDTQRYEDLKQRQDQLSQERADLQSQVQKLSDLREQSQKTLENAQEKYRASQHQANDCRTRLENEKAGINSLFRQTSQLQSLINSSESLKQNLASTAEKLQLRQATISQDLEKLLNNRTASQTELTVVDQTITNQREQLQALKDQINSLDGQHREVTLRLSQAKEKRSGLQSRKNLLEEMQNRHEGVGETVKLILTHPKTSKEQGDATALHQEPSKPKKQEHAKKLDAPVGAFDFVQGLLVEMFETDPDKPNDAVIVETALGEYQQALVVDHGDNLIGEAGQMALASLTGRVHFLAPDLMTPIAADNTSPDSTMLAGLPRVVDLVKYPESIAPIARRLLGQTLVAPSLDEAMRLRSLLPDGYRFVTATGQLLDANGRVSVGSGQQNGSSTAGGLIGRRSELAKLHKQLEQLEIVIQADQQQLVTLGDKTFELDRMSEELRRAHQKANTQRVELTSRIENLSGNIVTLERQKPELDRETQLIHQQIEQATINRQKYQQQVQQLEQDLADRQKVATRLTQEIQTFEAQVDHAREAVTTLRVESGKIVEQLGGVQRQERQLEITLGDIQRQYQAVVNHLANYDGRIRELQTSMEEAQQEGLEATTRCDQLEVALADIQAKIKTVDAEYAQLKASTQQARQQVEIVEKTIHQHELHQAELEGKINGIKQRVQEQLNLDVVEAYQSALVNYQQSVQAWEEAQSFRGNQEPLHFDQQNENEATDELEDETKPKSPFEIDWQMIESKITELRGKIDRLGSVNLDAIGEQTELESQHVEMVDQVKDIENAKGSLEELIRQINDDSRRRFEETFNQIRENFAGKDGMFRRLFGGGKADIFLQPDEQGNIDVLESGIEILAKPPGKEPQSISLLSGGEKTMTAVALLLSIFKTKPSPFCILDEVDAALDETNVSRFSNIIHSFLDQSHFIVITHHKGTMQSCDMLYGITMQERGVSKRVAVQFDQVGADGQIDRKSIDEQNRRDSQALEALEAGHANDDSFDGATGLAPTKT